MNQQLFRASLLSALVVFTLNTGAQTSPASLVLEEVIVTATKREQSLRDVAIAVTALSADLIQESHIQSAEELAYLVPSLNLQKGGNADNTSFSIRGIGTQSFSSAIEPSVSTMLDGVVMGRSGQAFMQLLDIERIEVLRGPQGTLFGKNSTGGVVHLITQNPSDEFSGEVMGSVISEDEYRAGLTVSGPISDDLGYRFSATGTDLGGYIRNAYDGNKLNGEDSWSVRGKLRWFPTESLELKWTSDFSDRSCDCSASPVRSLEAYGGNDAQAADILANLAPVTPGDENEVVNINKLPFSKSRSWGHSLEANWDMGDYVLTSITALREFEVSGFNDPDSQPTDFRAFDQFGFTETEQFTQELRLLSPTEGSLTYVAGLFWFDQKLTRNFRRHFEIISGFPGDAVADFQVETRNWAVFGEATWQIVDDWRLIFGARYTEDELEFSFARTLEGQQIGLPPPVELTRGDTDENDLSGKIALQWEYSESGMTYVSYTQGYKGPAFDMTFGTDPVGLPPVAPEVSDSWELGLKTTLLDGRVQLSAAVFHSVYDDFQAQSFFDPDGVPPECPDDSPNCNEGDDPGGFILINAGEVSSQGLELDFLAQISENLRMSGGFAIIDASIDDYPAGQCSGGQVFREFNGCSRTNSLQDLSGGDLPFSPDWKASLTASYAIPFDGDFNMTLRGSVRAQDDVLYSLSQDEFTEADGYAIFDAALVFRGQRDTWDATVFVKNIADKFHELSIQANNFNILPNGYNHRFAKQARRTYGVELRYRWM